MPILNMERRAILIDCSPTPPPKADRNGTLNAFHDFLCSPSGGSWEQEEITLLDQVAIADIQKAVTAAKDSDFTLVLVIAAGVEAKMGRPWPEVRIDAVDGTLNERELNPGCARCLMIFDCTGSRQSVHAQVDYSPSKNDTRKKYDEAIRAAEAGLVKVFASKAEGGAHLVWSLLAASHDWATTGSGILHVGDMVARIQQNRDDSLQSSSVKYIGGRRLKDFPFCIFV